MISSADEFLAVLNDPDPLADIPLRWERASTEVWLEVLERAPDAADAVALNKVLPDEVLCALATHSDWRVRLTVAQKNRLPLEALKILARDEDGTVRRVVAWNRRMPREILTELLDDPWEPVREVARERLSVVAAEKEDSRSN